LLLPLTTRRAIIHAMPRSSEERIAQSGDSYGHPTDRLDLSVRGPRVRGKRAEFFKGPRFLVKSICPVVTKAVGLTPRS
jgi:hypothetical protein